MKVLSSLFVAALGLTLGVGLIANAERAGPYAVLGTWSELLPPVLGALVASVVCGALLMGSAWGLWRIQHKMASQLLGIVAGMSPILIWQGVHVANVSLDTSEPVWHPTRLVRMQGRKNQEFFVIQSWRDPQQTLTIEIGEVVWNSLEPGDPAVLKVYSGAFGRPYAVALCRTPACIP